MVEDTNQKLSKFRFTLLWFLLALFNAVILQGLVVFFSALKQFNMIITYIIIAVLSAGAGLFCSAIINRFTQDDGQIAIASILSILPAAISAGVVLKIIINLSTQLKAIPEAGTAGLGSASAMVSIFNQNIPNYIAVAIMMFIFFNAIFFIEFIEKKNKRMFVYYLIGFIILILLVIIGGFIPGYKRAQMMSPADPEMSMVRAIVEQCLKDTVNDYINETGLDTNSISEAELDEYVSTRIDSCLEKPIGILEAQGYHLEKETYSGLTLTRGPIELIIEMDYPINVNSQKGGWGMNSYRVVLPRECDRQPADTSIMMKKDTPYERYVDGTKYRFRATEVGNQYCLVDVNSLESVPSDYIPSPVRINLNDKHEFEAFNLTVYDASPGDGFCGVDIIGVEVKECIG